MKPRRIPRLLRRAALAACVSLLAVLAMLPDDAAACGRCGFSRCRYVSPVKTVFVPKVQEKLVPVPVDQSNRSISVTYNIQVAEPAVREGETSYRTYAGHYNPLSFNFDAWREGAQQYQQLAASHAEASDARVATVVEGIARIQGAGLSEAVQLEKYKLLNRFLDGDDAALTTYLKINERRESSASYSVETGDGGGGVSALGNDPLALFRRDGCLKCHSGDAPKASLDLSDVATIRANGERILAAVLGDGDSPPSMPLRDGRPAPLSMQARVQWAQMFAPADGGGQAANGMIGAPPGVNPPPPVDPSKVIPGPPIPAGAADEVGPPPLG